MRDKLAMSMTKFFRFIADTFFAKRYGHTPPFDGEYFRQSGQAPFLLYGLRTPQHE